MAFARLGRTIVAIGLLTGAAGSIAWAQSDLSADRLGIDQARTAQTYTVNVRALNFRPEPTLAKPPLAVLQDGDYLYKREETFNDQEQIQWFRMQRAGGQEGWVSSRFVTPVSEALRVVEGSQLFLASLLPSAEPSSLPPFDSVRAGFIYPSPVGDGGWTYQHDQGRQSLERLEAVASTSYIESVPEEPALVADAIDQLVKEGNNLIFATSYGYMDPVIDAAKKYPDVVFMHASGFKTAANVGTYFGRIYTPRYLSGMIAGGMTKSNVVGYVAAFPIPEVIRGINAFALGAQSINPNVEVKVVWTNTWYGPGIEREKAELLADQGADVLTVHQDSPATIQVAELRGLSAIGYHSDMSVMGPNATLTSVVWDWRDFYQRVAGELVRGEWRPTQRWLGLEDGIVKLAPLSDRIPTALARLVEQQRQALIDGRARIFDGPIRSTDGSVRVPSGRTANDADLLTMDYYVLGVTGGIAPSIELPEDDGTG